VFLLSDKEQAAYGTNRFGVCLHVVLSLKPDRAAKEPVGSGSPRLRSLADRVSLRDQARESFQIAVEGLVDLGCLEKTVVNAMRPSSVYPQVGLMRIRCPTGPECAIDRP
jgi:hypothetical protein